MKTKKVEVFEFDPQIYPIKFWILINPTKESLDRGFVNLDDNKLNIDSISLNKDLTDAFVYNTAVKLVKTGAYGLLLCVNNIDYLSTSSIAHESTHLSGYLWDYVGEHEISSDTEANAYLVGWFAKCIDQVITKLKK